MSDVSPETSFYEIFQSAIEIEKVVGKIYRIFTDLFSDFNKIADFWKRMNEDEIGHANWLLEVKESASEEELSSYADYELTLKVHSIKRLLDECLKKEVENLDEAYELANEIESSEINNLFRLLTNKFISSEDKKKVIFSEINEHQLKIMNFPKNFGDKIFRREITVE